ncbi:prepilin-type N-terminal cleavage/methylation domain-containing protein [Blautia glucerasea]|nr:prepilin-type N-terminal cleavage/methylation domain-containing protein [Blautia glucerasea]MCB5423384.1 prepilin-type N-terminal cleavage/methylation domain-containing protein [Blautia luti]
MGFWYGRCCRVFCKTTKGFSLPELLIVVALIAALVSCSIPI